MNLKLKIKCTYILNLWVLTNCTNHHNFDVALKCLLLYILHTMQFMRNKLLETDIYFFNFCNSKRIMYDVHYTYYMSRVIYSKKCLKKVYLPDSRISAVGSFKSEATCHVLSCHVFTFKIRAWGRYCGFDLPSGDFGKQRWCRIICRL